MDSKVFKNNEAKTLLQIAEDRLNPKAFEKLKEFIIKQKKISKEQIDVLMTILTNEE